MNKLSWFGESDSEHAFTFQYKNGGGMIQERYNVKGALWGSGTHPFIRGNDYGLSPQEGLSPQDLAAL
jgi:hypothetical protein